MKIKTNKAKKAPAPKAGDNICASPQITTGSPQGPMTPHFRNYTFGRVDAKFYETLREGIPVIDAGIRRIISLNGTIRPIGDDMSIVKELEDFFLNVPVNDMQKGIHAFKENAENETLEQGFSISEFVATKKRDDIERLIVADSKRIVFRQNAEGRYEPWYRTGEALANNYTMPGSIINEILNARYGSLITYNGVEEVKLLPENKIYFSINNENSDPYGVSIIRSLPFVAQTLVTIQNAMKSTAERFGDPAFHAHYSGKSSSEDLKTRQAELKKEFNAVITSKRQGNSGDLVTAGGPDSSVDIKVIGHDGQALEFEIQTRHLLEQIISKFNLPAWMLGIYWSTTERMATLEIEAALADAKIRQFAMLPEYLRLCSAFLRLRGKTWKSITTSVDKAGDWGIIFESPNVRDLVAQAQARFLNAQADMMQGAAGSINTQNTAVGGVASVEIGGMNFPLAGHGAKGCRCGKEHKHIEGIKEIQRPIPWPVLDKIETDYENKLKTEWAELKYKVMTTLKLSVGAKGQKDDIPSIESFTYTEEQRQAIMKALEQHIGIFDLSNTDSAVRWYYGQSYSAGLIQAAYLLSKDRPILDIIKNREVYDDLCKNGFQLVKDNATRAIQDSIIPEMERQMLAGANPVHVGDRLEKLFGNANSDWERLARSEMSMAAERAKLDEWKEWKIEMVEFTPAPDGCSICMALKGDYPIDKCPLPVQNTHPRCRCSTRPAASEVGALS